MQVVMNQEFLRSSPAIVPWRGEPDHEAQHSKMKGDLSTLVGVMGSFVCSCAHPHAERGLTRKAFLDEMRWAQGSPASNRHRMARDIVYCKW